MPLYRFSKNTQISYCIKIRSLEAKLFREDGRTDGQTDRYEEANSFFHKFSKAHNIVTR